MKLLRLGPVGREIPAVEDDEGRVFDARDITDDIDGDFLASDGISRVRAALDARTLPELDHAALRRGAPIARPTAVVCVGQNYAAHAAESGDSPPEVPIIFFKHPNTVIGPDDDVELPTGAAKLDWEVELGVVIGRPAHRLASAAEALSVIAGLVVSHDVSERAWQVAESGGQWSKGKCAPTFNPLGPYLVPLEDSPALDALTLWSRVNGESRQHSSTADMIFDVPHLIHHLSQYMRLEPGDLINTGTPQGVALSGRFAYLRTGDVVELGIDGLGSQRQEIVAER
ncbi:2-keto-4-pentenoate hydratase/2-oxohepta-3-ene-1,7-dioic acid hydratase in catechol pathway [Microbacterium marinum]|uniref:2-keto-4-pentenoate hydratase/2-oxohepta-3-ene-1,7-dioic acid hydratase in catechol pathway n=1 Tax=Microbacterium marinum TaxID=421115 RepID=A0A7W7FMD0_9MICO|nr:fumarylacetoacetate hydrolase family protein [Microbacterium marinum]MBB4668244.1 2-keto-4-pentenoate hydratase/2-oxohepta-3-ene-1,7-dioic acid hydratase in catechol pathway [Microbacterium marinum]